MLSTKSTNRKQIKSKTDVVESTTLELYKVFAHYNILEQKKSRTTYGINPNIYNNVKLRQINDLIVLYDEPDEKILTIYNSVNERLKSLKLKLLDEQESKEKQCDKEEADLNVSNDGNRNKKRTIENASMPANKRQKTDTT